VAGPHTGPGPGPSRESGFILIAVLWIVGFLALAIAGFTVATRSHVQEASAEAASAEAGSLADAGVNLAIADLVNAASDPRWRRRFAPDAQTRGCSIGGAALAISIVDEAGRVDLNMAGEDLLRALISGVGRPAEEARSLAARVLDWRDPDSTKRPDGAEAPEYRDAGRPEPRNAPFAAPEELARVLGFDAALIARLRPFVTIYSRLPGIDVRKASPELIDVLAGNASNAAAAAFTFARRARLPPSFAAPSTERVFRVRASATTPRGGAFLREAVVEIVPGRITSFTMLAWTRPNVEPATPSIDLGGC
jgi:general secretion pathway protein K